MRHSSKPEVVRWLLARGADPHVEDEEGKTPLEVALREHEEDVVRVFREHGVEK